ncbi:MerR family transcriptional regulator [Streptomyces bomunensis]|uniref:MerR family transcriptional regulator n=1 Tax=Streptomyces montanisoli TaxID=2798581 RepID=A0A940MAP8_9ACTN|nr:MerR family transcriptional regulator [Streptomyces montanisoli]
MRELGIGDLARQINVRPSALRYYESLGLLPAARRVAGRRVYPASVLRRIALIKMAQRPDSPSPRSASCWTPTPTGAPPSNGAPLRNARSRNWTSSSRRRKPYGTPSPTASTAGA